VLLQKVYPRKKLNQKHGRVSVDTMFVLANELYAIDKGSQPQRTPGKMSAMIRQAYGAFATTKANPLMVRNERSLAHSAWPVVVKVADPGTYDT
jgi:hypothetical protein